MFITRFDLETTLNVTDMNVLAQNDSDYKSAYAKAIETVKSYIQHRYDVSEVFVTVNTFNPQTEYAVGDIVFYNNKYYICSVLSQGNLPTDTDYFTQGDTRNQSILDIICILTIFYLFRKVQPRNIPEWINEEYDRKIDDLKAYQRGTRTILLTVSTDTDDEQEGHRVSYGTETQKDWNY